MRNINVDEAMRRVGELVLRTSIPLLIFIVAITPIFLLCLPRLELRDDESTWLLKDDPALINYHHFRDLFGNDKFVIIGYESDDPFCTSEIAYLSYLTERLGEVPHIAETASLTNAGDLRKTGGRLAITALLEERNAPKTELQRSRLENRIDSNPFAERLLISGDRKTIGILLEVEEAGLPSEIVTYNLTRTLESILSEEHRQTARQFYLGGGAICDGKITEVIINDMQLLTPMVLSISALLLLVIFRHWACALFPLITVILSLIWTFGLKSILGSPVTPLSATLVALVTIIGVANSVHLIASYRLGVGRSSSKRTVILNTYAKAGTPCFFTSLTSAAGFGSLAISSIPAVRNLGIFASAGIMISFLLSMIIVPLGLQLVTKPNEAKKNTTKRWESIGKFGVGNSKWIVPSALLLSLVLGLGSLNVQMEGSMLQYFREDSRIKQSADFLDEELSGTSSMELVIIGNRGSFQETEALRQIEHLQGLMENYPTVTGSLSMVDYIKLANRAIHGYDLDYSGIPEKEGEIDLILRSLKRSESSKIEEYYIEGYQDVARVSLKTSQMDQGEIDTLMKKVQGFTAENFQNYDWMVTGFDPLSWNIAMHVVRTQLQSLGLAFLVIFGLIMVLFGLRGGLASILPNMIPIAFLFGFMNYAGFRLNVATVMIASIAIGLVVDDTIHYFYHFKENFIVTGDREQAAIAALQYVGGALLFTTLILAGGFIILVFSQSAFLADFGILSALVMIVALLGDLLVGPALLSRFNLFGRQHKMKT